jgi:hypothetical protein
MKGRKPSHKFLPRLKFCRNELQVHNCFDNLALIDVEMAGCFQRSDHNLKSAITIKSSPIRGQIGKRFGARFLKFILRDHLTVAAISGPNGLYADSVKHEMRAAPGFVISISKHSLQFIKGATVR